MEDKELLLNLNKETKAFLDDAFSYLDYFINGKQINNDEKEKYISWAFLLAILLKDYYLKQAFSKHGITYEKIASKILNKDDFIPKHAEDSDFFNDNDFSSFMLNVYERIKYNNSLNNLDIPVSYLQPYQIFDYIAENYFYGIEEILQDLDIDFVDDVLPDLYESIHQADKIFNYAAESGRSIQDLTYRKTYEFENAKILEDGDDYSLIFKDGFDFEKNIISGIDNDNKPINKEEISSSLKTNEEYEISLVSGYPFLNESLVNDIFYSDKANDQVTIKFYVPKKGFYTVTFDRKKSFSKPIDLEEEKKEIINNIMKFSSLEPKEKTNKKEIDTTYLDKYGFDLTKEKYLKDPCIGRNEKIRELEKILLYPEKDKSIVITGIAGCGKTALVKGLAYRIQKGDVPEALKNLKIYNIDCATLVAGTKYVGTLEEKMKSILEEASSSKDIVLFMDEIHQALGAGKSEGNDNSVSEILKPYLDYGRARIIGATTTEEYNDYVSQDAAFRTRLKRISLKAPDNETIYSIIDDLIENYNKFSYSELLVPYEEREMIINLLIDATQERHTHYNDRASNPRLVLDIIKDAYAIAALNDKTEVSVDDIAEALREEERLTSSKNEMAERLLNMVPTPKKDNVIQFRLIKK